MMMGLKGEDTCIAGAEPSLADIFLGPLVFYASLTDDKESILSVVGLGEWCQRLQTFAPFAKTAPDL